MHTDNDILIRPKEALKILTFVSRAGLYIGSRGTKTLTRFPVNGQTLFSKKECEDLRDAIRDHGIALKEKAEFDSREIPTELV